MYVENIYGMMRLCSMRTEEGLPHYCIIKIPVLKSEPSQHFDQRARFRSIQGCAQMSLTSNQSTPSLSGCQFFLCKHPGFLEDFLFSFTSFGPIRLVLKLHSLLIPSYLWSSKYCFPQGL